MATVAGCSHCHDCGANLSSDEWCGTCRAFRRYFEHGWGNALGSPGGRCYGFAHSLNRLFQLRGPAESLVTLITKGSSRRRGQAPTFS